MRGVRAIILWLIAGVIHVPAMSMTAVDGVDYGEGMRAGRPDLVVGLVIDRMRYDYVERMWDRFGEDGLKRLFSGGASFSNARYSHLVNQSASGYATISTGSDPSAHGIIADHWYDRLRDGIQNSVYDEKRSAVGGTYAKGQRSPHMLVSATIGDQLRMSTDFKSRVFTVSMNDAAAVLSGGFSANSAWWFDDISGSWMTSTFYIDSLPSWVRDFNNGMLPETYLERVWEPARDWALYTGAGEDGRNEPFRYDLRRMRRRGDDYRLLRSTPFGNTFTLDFARNLMVNEGLGRRGGTDMLIIGFSSTGEIDRYYGTFSKELQDAYIRLDRDIAYLLKFLDDYYGMSNVLVFMTSDSGAGYPENYNRRARLPSGTFSPGMAMALLRSYLNVTYGTGEWVQAYNAGMVYLNHDLIYRNNIPIDEIQHMSARFLGQISGVAGAVSEGVISRNNFTSGMNYGVQAGFYPPRSGDVMIYFQPGWHERNVAGDRLELVYYDRHVPLVFFGWNVQPVVINRRVSIADIAPTISLMLNIPKAASVTGQPVLEIVR